MITGIVFLVVGFVMIFAEFFLPGGLMGLVGGLFCLVGLVLFAVGSPSIPLTIGVFVVTIVALFFLGRFALKRVRKSRVYLSTDQQGYKASKFAEDLMGKEGEVLADLKPSGHIRIDGKRYQAVSRMGYLEKGTKIVVIGGEGAHLIVKKGEVKDGN
jgi:membrane-bound ClpP family serine protease